MGGRSKGAERKKEHKRAVRRARFLKWTLGVGAIALIVYGLSQASGIAYSDRDIKVVDFSGLSRTEKNVALRAANDARCTCGCGMTLAECVATDSTCPLRDGNIVKISRMVEQARQSRPGS